MSTRIVSLSSNLPFDDEQEQDIVKFIEELKKSHRIGQFLATIIRIVYDNPEILDKSNGQILDGPTVKKVNDLGMSANRYQFMKSITKEVDDMKIKVDKVYELVSKTYELGLMGNHLAIDKKAKNDVLASFILQKQVKDLQDALGIQLTSSVFASNKTKDLDEFAQEALEYIINSYSNIIGEIKQIKDTQQIVVQQPQSTATNVVKQESSSDNADEIIDYGTIDSKKFGESADIKALQGFFSLR